MFLLRAPLLRNCQFIALLALLLFPLNCFVLAPPPTAEGRRKFDREAVERQSHFFGRRMSEQDRANGKRQQEPLLKERTLGISLLTTLLVFGSATLATFLLAAGTFVLIRYRRKAKKSARYKVGVNKKMEDKAKTAQSADSLGSLGGPSTSLSVKPPPFVQSPVNSIGSIDSLGRLIAPSMYVTQRQPSVHSERTQTQSELAMSTRTKTTTTTKTGPSRGSEETGSSRTKTMTTTKTTTKTAPSQEAETTGSSRTKETTKTGPSRGSEETASSRTKATTNTKTTTKTAPSQEIDTTGSSRTKATAASQEFDTTGSSRTETTTKTAPSRGFEKTTTSSRDSA